MKIINTCLFVLSIASLSAQTWVENNATWHYDYWNLSEGGFYKVTHVGDTLITGKACKKFDIEKHQFYIYTGNPQANDTIIYTGDYQMGTKFTYQSNDSVFHWDQNEFQLLFDFGAQIGDSWIVSTQPGSFGCSDTSIVEVIGVGTENINGVNYRYLDLLSPDSSSWTLNGHFNERFGATGYIFPLEQACDAVVEWDILTFKCFEDDSLTLYNPSGEDCEYLLNHLSLNELTLKPSPKKLVKIVDIMGREVKEKPNMLLIYQYSDGTSKKVYRAE